MLLRTLPRMSRPHAAVELSAWALMAIPMGVLSGGVAGVIVHPVFDGEAPVWALGLAVALLTGAGSIANVTSIFWAHLGRGRHKVRLITALQAGFCGCLLAAAAVPVSGAGLVMFALSLLCAQILWCGVITTRANVWRQNYSRAGRTAFAARNQAIVALIQAGTGAATGWLIGADPSRFRSLLVAVCLAAAVSLARARGLRLRRSWKLRDAEAPSGSAGGFDPRRYVAVLADDPMYRRYMKWMMVLGSGNLMFTAPLILVMTDALDIPGSTQVWITAALPTLIAPVAMPYWARRLSRQHVIAFRAANSRWYATALALLATGAIGAWPPLLWLGAAVLGVGIAGGVLGWNLGHNDFAADDRVAEYVGIHVSLTGVRGLIAPMVGVGLYGALESRSAGAGAWALLLPAVLSSCGAFGFNRFRKSLAKRRG